MSFGKLYNYPKAPRSTMCLYIIEANKLDVEFVEAWPIKVDSSKGGVGDEYLAKFPPGKVPALERPDGFTLFECIAVSWYLARQDPQTTLLGMKRTPEEESKILSWCSFANMELLPPIMSWINPVIGKAPLLPDSLEKAEKALDAMILPIEKALSDGQKFIVGDCLTIADLFVVAALGRGYQFVLTEDWAAKHPVVHQYYLDIRNDPIYIKVDGHPKVLQNIAFPK